MKKIIIVFTLVCTILVAQFFGIGSNLPAAYADDLTGTTSTDTPTIYDFITNLHITQTGPDDHLPPNLGSDVPQNGEFRMTYVFEIPQFSGLTDDDYFFLILPEYVHVPTNAGPFIIRDSSYLHHVLDVSMLMASDPSNTTGVDAIRIDFTSDLEAETDNYTYFGEFWFEASFDADEVDEGGMITMGFDSGRSSSPYSIDIDFIEDPPTLPTLVKDVTRTWNAAENRHYYTWELDFNPEDVDVGENVVITDVLDFMTTYLFNETNTLGDDNDVEISPGVFASDLRYMEYIGNVTQTDGTASYNISYNDPYANADYANSGDASIAPELSITFTEAVTEQQTFTFQTAVYANAYINLLNEYNSRDLDFDNDAEAATDLGTINSNIVSSDHNIDVINKNRVGSVDTINRRITYRIEANPYDYIVDNAYVTDELPDGLTMDTSSITFTYDDGTTAVAGATWSLEDNGTPTVPDDDYYRFDLGNISEEVWINFEVTIDDDQYYDQASITYRNDAYFHPPVTESWRTRGRRDVGVSTDVIRKSSTAIDITNGIITWQLRINPNTNTANPVQLADIVVIDPIPDNITTNPATTNNGLDYYLPYGVHINRAIDGEVAGASAYYDSVNNQIVVDFNPDDTSDGGDIIEQEYIITYQTQIVDEYIYKRNQDSSVTNTAHYTSYNAGAGSDSTTRDIIPDMLQKEFVSYDYDTHYFRWHIHVNPNNNELLNCVVADYISDDMNYVPNSFEIYDGSGSPYTGGTLNGTTGDGEAHSPSIANPQAASENISHTLEYTFPANTTDSYDIYFETEYVDYDQMADNHLDLTSDYLEASNTAYLVHSELPTNTYVIIGDSERFTSSVVEKAPEYSSGEQYIDWVVTINKNQIDIYGPSPVADPDSVIDGPVIYDTLQQGLVIDLESIKLYDATVNSDNSITVDRTAGSSDEVSYDRNTQITYNGNTRQLTFAFEDTISTCYVMTFRTYIESGYRNTVFSNTASFHALAGDEDNTSSDEHVLFATGGGYASANIGHLLLTKVDSVSGLPLAGATFELLDSSGTVVDVQVTDSSGEALFEFIFFNRQYYYRESIIPYGYSGDTATVTAFMIDSVTATDEPDDPDRTYTPADIENTANPVSVEFTKYAEDGVTGLPGATFAIYNVDPSVAPSPTAIATATSDAAGLVTLNNLAANNTYYIQEIVPPLGYMLDTTVLRATVTVGDVPFTPTPSSITNVQDTSALSSVTFTKFAEDGTTPLAGCVFGIYPALVPTALMGTATSQADGSVTFTNVAMGDYVIRELSTLTGYELSTDELTVTVGAATGTYVTTPATLTNYLDGSVEVEVHSTFSLKGMSFRIGLFRLPGYIPAGELEYVDGSLSNFERLQFATYAAHIMPNSYGLAGSSQDGTITVSDTHTHVDIYITRNPQTGDKTSILKYILLGLVVLFACVCAAYIYKKRKAESK